MTSSTSLLCLSNHTTEHSQTNFDDGTIFFTLPPNLRTSTWTHVALESLNANIEPDVSDRVTVVVGSQQRTYSIESMDNTMNHIQRINSTVDIDPLFTLLPSGHVQVTIAPPTDRIIINERLACCLGLQETVLTQSFRGPFRADINGGIAPVIVCAPKLVSSAHDCANQGQMDVLKILPAGVGRYEHSFSTTSPVPLAGSLKQDISIQFCSPAFPLGMPIKKTPMYAALRLTTSAIDI